MGRSRSFPPRLRAEIELLHQKMVGGTLTDSDLARASGFQEFVSGYIDNFWYRHGAMITQQTRNLEYSDLYAVAAFALFDALRNYQAGKGDLIEWLRLRMYQECHDHVRRNYAAGREDWQGSAPSDRQILRIEELFYPSEEGKSNEDRGTLELCSVDTDPLTESEMQRRSLMESIRALPHPYEAVVRFHHFDGHSFEEVGKLIDPERPVHRGTVYRWFGRALACLRGEVAREALPIPKRMRVKAQR